MKRIKIKMPLSNLGSIFKIETIQAEKHPKNVMRQSLERKSKKVPVLT
jgi:hypothetical protein